MTAPAPALSRWPAGPLPRYFDPREFGLGLLVPVVGGHPGVGASGVALALADAAAAGGLRTLLVDGADPARSGLAHVWTSQLRTDAPCRDGASLGTVARPGLVGRQMRSIGRPVPSRLYPALTEWAAADFVRDHAPFEVTVVDVGWNAWIDFDEIRYGPLAWLSAAASSSHPVLVGAATWPSMRLTAGVHARWAAALASGDAEAGPRLAVVGCSQVPPTSRANCPPSLSALLDDAICFPRIPSASTVGWTEQPLPRATLTAAGRLLATASAATASRLPITRTTTPHRFRRTSKET